MPPTQGVRYVEMQSNPQQARTACTAKAMQIDSQLCSITNLLHTMVQSEFGCLVRVQAGL